MHIIYTLSLVYSFLLLTWFFVSDVKSSIIQHLMLLVLLCSNVGYICMINSANLEAAILSNKILYLGGTFLPILYYFTVCQVCHIKVYKRAFVPMFFVQVGIYLLICTIGHNDLYYKSVSFHKINNLSYITKEYGPTHIIFVISMWCYIVAASITAIYTVFKHKSINKRELNHLLLFLIGAISSYFLQRAFKLKFDIMPVVYNIMMTGALKAVYKSNLFTVYENKDVINNQLNKTGFITLDKKMSFMGANDYALNLFPFLRKMKIGKKIVCDNSVINNLLIEAENFLQNINSKNLYDHQKGIDFQVGDNYFDTEFQTLLDFKHALAGATIEIHDISAYKKMLLLKEIYNDELNKDVEEKVQKIRQIQEKTILAMAQTVETRDLSTGGHIKRTSDVVKIFSDKLLQSDLDVSNHFLKLVIKAAPMHDIGKIGVPDAILQKQGRFTPEEFEKMKSHAQKGGELIRQILTGVEKEDFVQIAYNIASFHHEKVNGNGYPKGLKGDEIPIEARIMALADVFDALVSKRCYKEAFSFDQAFEIIKNDAGQHFDKQLAEIFLTCRSELEEYYTNISQ